MSEAFPQQHLFGLWPPGPLDTARLIASQTDFEEALRFAPPEERDSLIRGRRSTSGLDQISAAVGARLIIADRMGPTELLRYVQHLRNRYRVAAPSAYALYELTAPKDDDLRTNLIRLQAELHTISYRLRLAYSVNYVRDRHLAFIRAACAFTIFVTLTFIITMVTLHYAYGNLWPPLNFLVIAALGLGGAATSIAQRANKILATSPLEEDPIVQASALEQGQASLFVAALTGPVFALILLLIFIGGQPSFGGIAPAFAAPACASAHPSCRPDFLLLDYPVWLASWADAAKLGLWAFIAGFAERFVPDVLDSLAGAASARPASSGK